MELPREGISESNTKVKHLLFDEKRYFIKKYILLICVHVVFFLYCSVLVCIVCELSLCVSIKVNGL